MRIECEICGSYTEMEKPPENNICPVCFHVGSLFVSDEPSSHCVPLESVVNLDAQAKANSAVMRKVIDFITGGS